MTELSQILQAWIRRLRFQRALIWSLRGLIIGLALSLALGLLGVYRKELVRYEFLTLIVSVSLFSLLLGSGVAFLWPIKPLQAARKFDLLFHLNERVSTALELHQVHTNVPAEMMDRQLQDAIGSSNAVDLHRTLPLRLPLREGTIALVLFLLVGTVWLRGDRWFQAAQQAQQVEQAVAQQESKIEELIKQIEANDTLSEEQKQTLTQALQETQKSLQENPSLENSVSVLTSSGQKLQSLSDAQSDQKSQALKDAGNQLAKQQGSPLQSVGKDLAQGNYVSAAAQLQNMDVSKLSASEKQQLADQLDATANALQSTNPQLASQLSQASQALKSGDTTSAQQALSNAAQSLTQTGQQITLSQVAGQTASQLQQGAGQVLAAGGGQQADQTGQGMASNQGSNQTGQSDSSGGSGAGKGTGTGDNPTGNEANSSPIDQNNGPGDGGESTYEQIYAPTLLGGQGGPQVDLPNSGNGDGDVIGQGPTTPGDPSASQVPYDEVYSQYEEINNQAIENGDIPTQFMQIIKSYFDSLKP